MKLSLPLKRHICTELSYVDPRILRRVRPLPGVSRACAVMINSLENPISHDQQQPATQSVMIVIKS